MRNFCINRVSELHNLPIVLPETISNDPTQMFNKRLLQTNQYNVFVTINMDNPDIYELVKLVSTLPNFWVANNSDSIVKEVLAHRVKPSNKPKPTPTVIENRPTKPKQVKATKPKKTPLTVQQKLLRKQAFYQYIAEKKRQLDEQLANQLIVSKRFSK